MPTKMMLEENSDGVARFFESWLDKNVHESPEAQAHLLA